MAFTVFDSFAEVLDDFDMDDPEEARERALLCEAIVMYGLHGEEPDLPRPLRRTFRALKDAIDNSKDARDKGRRGGRPRKAPRKPEPEPEPAPEPERGTKTQVPESENPGFENGKPGFPESGNPNLTCTGLTYPDLTCDVLDYPGPDRAGAVAVPAFVPPTLEEARAYFGANCLRGDPDAFWAHYESQGWRKTNGMPVTSFTAAAMSWSRRQPRIDAGERLRGLPTAAEAERASTWSDAPDEDAEIARLEAEIAQMRAAS